MYLYKSKCLKMIRNLNWKYTCCPSVPHSARSSSNEAPLSTFPLRLIRYFTRHQVRQPAEMGRKPIAKDEKAELMHPYVCMSLLLTIMQLDRLQ